MKDWHSSRPPRLLLVMNVPRCTAAGAHAFSVCLCPLSFQQIEKEEKHGDQGCALPSHVLILISTQELLVGAMPVGGAGNASFRTVRQSQTCGRANRAGHWAVRHTVHLPILLNTNGVGWPNASQSEGWMKSTTERRLGNSYCRICLVTPYE